jgi:hypothetical protein
MRESIQALFVDGPRAAESDLVPFPPQDVYDTEVLADHPDEWEVLPGQEFGMARWEQHRYRLAGYGWDAHGARVVLYEHVCRLDPVGATTSS